MMIAEVGLTYQLEKRKRKKTLATLWQVAPRFNALQRQWSRLRPNRSEDSTFVLTFGGRRIKARHIQ